MNIKIIAHRGANRCAPQNTIPAFKKAIEMGSDGFETDIHISLDEVPVICHNDTIDETSTGKGAIKSLKLDELKKYDFGSYFDESFSGTAIPTLEEFLPLCKNLKMLNLELKGGNDTERRELLVKKTLELVKKYYLEDILIVSCFDPETLRCVKKIDPNCKTGFLFSENSLKEYGITDPIELMTELGCTAAHPQVNCVTKDFVKRAKEIGLQINVWTVDEPSDMRNLIEKGVDSLITDMPDRAFEVLAEYGE